MRAQVLLPGALPLVPDPIQAPQALEMSLVLPWQVLDRTLFKRLAQGLVLVLLPVSLLEALLSALNIYPAPQSLDQAQAYRDQVLDQIQVKGLVHALILVLILLLLRGALLSILDISLALLLILDQDLALRDLDFRLQALYPSLAQVLVLGP